MDILVKPDNDKIAELYSENKQFKDDAALDLYIPENHAIPPGTMGYMIDHKISVELFDGQVDSLLMPRSSISKTSLRMSNSIGLIDKNYRGHILAAVDNIGDDPVILERGQRLFQLLPFPTQSFNVEIVDKLSDTERGDKGFGEGTGN